MDEQRAIQEFLGDRPRSDQLSEWRETLEQRLQALEADAKEAGPGAGALQAKLAQLRKQVVALREEEAVTRYVEDSVRVTLAMGSVTPDLEGLDE
ncbi:MAG: hypothetical protein ACK47B_13375 [Armatimonadota bacterium]